MGRGADRSIEPPLLDIAAPSPFLRWAGGKRIFLAAYGHSLPAFEGKYIEPFLGGGAAFFYLRSRRPVMPARLSDINRHLIRTYTVLRTDPDFVADRLQDMSNAYRRASDPVQYYLDQRTLHNASHPNTDAARFIFLNRTCWNGLWRVNQKGHFNVPHGTAKPGASQFPTRADLRAAATALQGVTLRCAPWETSLKAASDGDFAFVDPPYFSDLTASHGRLQTKYHRDAFTKEDHERLADVLGDVSAKGAKFVLTNSPEPEMVRLYQSHGFQVSTIMIPRSINSKGDRRGGTHELIVTPGDGASLDEAAAALDLDAAMQRNQFATT